jgi:tetrahydromethanopterin S-methyltransferase subunit G
MSEAEAGNTNQSDPMETFREMRNAYLDLWSKNMIELVNSEGYAQASGAMLDNYLSATAPFRETFEKTMSQTLQQFGLPTSADFAGLAGRLTNIEMRLDDMDAKLDRIEKLIVPPQQFNELNAKLERIEKLTVPSQQFNELGAKLERIEKLIVPSQQFNELNTKLDRIEKLAVPSQQFNELDTKLDSIEKLVMRSQSIHQTAPVAPEAPKQTAAAKPPMQTAPVRQPGKTPDAMQRATTVKPTQATAKKGAK